MGVKRQDLGQTFRIFTKQTITTTMQQKTKNKQSNKKTKKYKFFACGRSRAAILSTRKMALGKFFRGMFPRAFCMKHSCSH